MPILVTCPCGNHFHAEDQDAGRRVTCPACGRAVKAGRAGMVQAVESVLKVPDTSGVSGEAIASLALGLFFFLACISGLPAIVLGYLGLRDINRSQGRLQGKRTAIAGIVLGVLDCLLAIALVIPATRSASEAARQSQCVNHLKQIGLAMSNYHSVNGCFPPAAIVDKHGKPLLSWRVLILPYMEQRELFEKFHLDEPWDSPHNLALVNETPLFYACPSDPGLKPGMTGYQVVIGPRTAFPPDFKPTTRDMPDGASNTILASESLRAVPWTRPEDRFFNPNVPLSGLGSRPGHHSNGFFALIADGSVKFLKSTIDPEVLNALLTRDGGEVIDRKAF